MGPKRDIARISDTVFHKEVYEPAEVRLPASNAAESRTRCRLPRN